MTDEKRPKFKRKLLLGERIIFAAIAKQVAVHFWVVPNWEDSEKSWGGVEFHQRPQAGQEPTDDWCFLLCGPCCHDGSASYAKEKLIPLFHICCEAGNGDYGTIFQVLELQLRRLISEREAAAAKAEAEAAAKAAAIADAEYYRADGEEWQYEVVALRRAAEAAHRAAAVADAKAKAAAAAKAKTDLGADTGGD